MTPTAPAARIVHDNQVVRSVVARLGDRIKWLDAITALLWVAAAATAYLLVFAAADHRLGGGFPRRVQVAVVGSFYLCAGLAVCRWVLWPMLRRINDHYVASLVERDNPDLGNTLLTALDVARRSDVKAGVASGLFGHAVRLMRRRDLSGCLPLREVRRSVIAATVSILLLTGYAAVSPKSIWPSLQRAFGADVPAPTLTQIEWISPDAGAGFIKGMPLFFEVRLRGRAPREAYVDVSVDAGKTWDEGRRVDLAPSDGLVVPGRSWAGTMPGHDAQRSIACRVVAGDAVTPVRRLTCLTPPVIRTVTATLRYPPYCRLPDRTTTGGDVDAVIGTRVRLSVRTRAAMARGVARFEEIDGRSNRPLQVDAEDPQHATAEWTVTGDGQYQVHVTDIAGASNPRPTTYYQHALPDKPPQAEVREPSGDLELQNSQTFVLRAAASDDFGLHDLSLVYRNGVAGGRLPLTLAADELTVEAAYRVPVAAFQAAPGDQIEWHLEAHDGRRDLQDRPAFQIGVSQTRTLRIVRPRGEPASAKSDDPSTGAIARMDDADGEERSPAASQPAGEGRAAASRDSTDQADSREDEERDRRAAEKLAEQAGGDADNGETDETGAEKPGEKNEDQPGEGQGNKSGEGKADGEKRNGQKKPGSGDANSGKKGKGDKPGESQPGQQGGQNPGKGEGKASDKTGTGQGAQQGKTKAASSRPGGDAGSNGGNPEDRSQGEGHGEFGGQGAGRHSPDGGGRMDRAVDELERRLREGRIGDDELKDLGWTRAQAQQFVRKYRARQIARRETEPGREGDRARGARTGPATGGDAARLGGFKSGGMGGTIQSDRTAGGERPGLRDAPREDVPPEYRDLLDAYYREMAKGRGETPKGRKVKTPN